MDPYHIHGLTPDIDYGSSDSGESDFDEEYWRLKPPPLKITEHNIMVIMPTRKQKRVANQQRKIIDCSTVLHNNISKSKLAHIYHTVDEYGIVKSNTRTRNFFSVLESSDSEDSAFKENEKSAPAINTQYFFGAKNGMNSNMKKKRRGRKQRIITDRVQKKNNSVTAAQKNAQRNKDTGNYLNAVQSQNIENISNDLVHLVKIEPHIHETVHSVDVQNNSSKRKKRRRRRHSNRLQSYLRVSEYTSTSFGNVENTTKTKTSHSNSVVPLKNKSDLKKSEIFTITKAFQKVEPTNDPERENVLNISKVPLPQRFQERYYFVIDQKSVPVNKSTDASFNTIEFDSEVIENIYNSDSVHLDKVEHVAPNALNSENTMTNTLQEVGSNDYSNETENLLPLQLSKQLKCGNMMKYKTSPLEKAVLELSSEYCWSGTSNLTWETWDVKKTECVYGLRKNDVFPMPKEPPSYFKQILKYLHSNQNAIIIGLIAWYFFKRGNVRNIHFS